LVCVMVAQDRSHDERHHTTLTGFHGSHGAPMPRQVRTEDAQRIVTGAQSSGDPEPIDTAPREAERTLLLWCPEQGGWQTGQWCEGRWGSAADVEHELSPTHRTPIPPDMVGR
jgi:hypothetical protein